MSFTLSEPVYKITCPACLKDNLYSLFEIIFETKVHCSCHESIAVADHYRRTEIADLLKLTGPRRGTPGLFIGASDSKWFANRVET
jgi:hypothetical protein